MGRAIDWLMRRSYLFWLLTYGALAVAGSWLAGGVTRVYAPGEKFQSIEGFAVRAVLFVFLCVAILPLAVLCHELGHLLAGRAVGIRTRSLRVGPLLLERSGERWKTRWSPAPLGILGLHLGEPVGLESLGPRLAVHVAGGPVASLALLVGVAAVLAALPSPVTPAETFRADLLRATALLTGLLLVDGLVPRRARSGYMSDAALFLIALARDPAVVAYRRFHWAWRQGRRPRDWGLDARQLLELRGRKDGLRGALLLAGFAIAMDSGDEALAREALSRLDEQGVDLHHRRELVLQRAMLRAFDGEAALARSDLEEARPLLATLGSGSAGYLELAEGVVEAAEGDRARAGEAMARWERATSGPGGPALRAGNEWAEERLRVLLAGTAPDGAAARPGGAG